MTEINLKEQLHEGCTVHFRCGGSAVVESVIDTTTGNKNVIFKDNGNGTSTYYEDGTRQLNQALFDIVKVDPKPFDWKDAKNGMCFKNKNGYSRWYIGEDFCGPEAMAIFSLNDTCTDFKSIHLSELTRYEEGDLK